MQEINEIHSFNRTGHYINENKNKKCQKFLEQPLLNLNLNQQLPKIIKNLKKCPHSKNQQRPYKT